jgi:hypothetical protein
MDLIAELERNAKGYTQAALIVGFDGSTIYVKADNPRRLELLNEAIENGGEPVGWYRLDHPSGKIEWGILAEHQNERWAHQYLEALAKTVEAGLTPGGN